MTSWEYPSRSYPVHHRHWLEEFRKIRVVTPPHYKTQFTLHSKLLFIIIPQEIIPISYELIKQQSQILTHILVWNPSVWNFKRSKNFNHTWHEWLDDSVDKFRDVKGNDSFHPYSERNWQYVLVGVGTYVVYKHWDGEGEKVFCF